MAARAARHRRIAVAVQDSEANLAHVYRRAAALALRSQGLDPDMVLSVEPSEAGGLALARRLLEVPDRPTALMSCCESMLPGLYGGLRQAGLRPGADLSVTGFRDHPGPRHLVPPLAHVRLDLASLGAAVAEATVGTLDPQRGVDAADRRRLWPPELLEAGSIAAARTRPGVELAALGRLHEHEGSPVVAEVRVPGPVGLMACLVSRSTLIPLTHRRRALRWGWCPRWVRRRRPDRGAPSGARTFVALAA